MELTDVLLTFAQAAMVIAGFGGVVVTFNDKSDKWGDWDRIQFRSLTRWACSGLSVWAAGYSICLRWECIWGRTNELSNLGAGHVGAGQWL